MNRPARVLLPLLLLSLEAGCHAVDPSHAPAARAEPTAREGVISAPDGVRLYYRAVGTGRDTLIVVHGGPGFTMEYLARDLEPLAEGRTLVFYDQRGTGRSTLVSDSAALGADRFVDDLDAVRAHFGLERVRLLGHSWGAGLIALYAARHPQRLDRLLVVGAIPARRSDLTEAFQAMAAGRDSGMRVRMREARDAWVADPGNPAACRAYYVLWYHPFYGDAAAASRSRGDFCAGTPESLRNKMASVDRFTMASLGDWDWISSLRGVPAPTLLIHGTEDPLPVRSAREWVAALPNARLLLLEGIGHFPYVEAPERFFPAADAFLKGTWPADARRQTSRPLRRVLASGPT
jgi:proline iminopeptidase